MKRFVLLFAVNATVLASFISCEVEKENDIPSQEAITLIADNNEEGSETRTYVIDGGAKVYWQPGDAIKLFRGTGSSKLTAAITTPSTSAPFSGFAPYGNGDYIGLYPYNDDSAMESGAVSVTLPAAQEALEGSFAPGCYITLGKSATTDHMLFYAACGGFRFSVGGEGIKSVVFQAVNNEPIAGNASVSFAKDRPELQPSDVRFSSITLTAPQGEYLRSGVWYYIVAFPTVLSGGYRLTFIKDDASGSKDFSDAVTIKRGSFGSRKNVDSGVVFSDYEDVDLGLSVKWATYNVGASRPEEYGQYYSWGEITPKTDYGKFTYKWYDYNSQKYTRYVTKWQNGAEDGLQVLEREDDAASQNWGGEWRTPTAGEFEELVNSCTAEWVTVNGVAGMRFTSKIKGFTNKFVFLPACGTKEDTYTNNAGTIGHYWSSSLNASEPVNSYSLSFNRTKPIVVTDDRLSGNQVRAVKTSDRIPVTSVELSPSSVTLEVGESVAINAVITPSNATYTDLVWSSSAPMIASVDDCGRVTAVAAGIASITATSLEGKSGTCLVTVKGNSIQPEAVDLGLSRKWASFNVGASRPEEFGGYFAWGETESGKSNYSWSTYKWSNGSSSSITRYTYFNGGTLLPEDDAATASWGESWRMPTRDEAQELKDNCNWVWTTENGVKGYRVYGTNGREQNSIFLPVSGVRIDDEVYYVGEKGVFWTSYYYYETKAYNLSYANNSIKLENDLRYYGLPVRPVKIEPTSIEISFTNLSMTVGNSQIINYAVMPEDVPDKSVIWKSSSPGIASVSQEGVVSAVSPGQALITVTTVDGGLENGCIVSVTGPASPVAVDLGLSVEWASFNLCASTPEDFGGFFAWGETAPKYYFDWSNYSLCEGTSTSLTKYNSDSRYGHVDKKTKLLPEDDAAAVLWGDGWRMPTCEEWDELANDCSWKWSSRNGVIGVLFTPLKAGYTNKTLFIPAAGLYGQSSYQYGATSCYYWSSEVYTKYDQAKGESFSTYGDSMLTAARSLGMSIRAVRDK